MNNNSIVGMESKEKGISVSLSEVFIIKGFSLERWLTKSSSR